MCDHDAIIFLKVEKYLLYFLKQSPVHEQTAQADNIGFEVAIICDGMEKHIFKL